MFILLIPCLDAGNSLDGGKLDVPRDPQTFPLDGLVEGRVGTWLPPALGNLHGCRVLPVVPPPCSREPRPVVFGCGCVVQWVGFLVLNLTETLPRIRSSQVTKEQLSWLGGRHRKPNRNCPYGTLPPCSHQAGHYHPKAAVVWKVSRS